MWLHLISTAMFFLCELYAAALPLPALLLLLLLLLRLPLLCCPLMISLVADKDKQEFELRLYREREQIRALEAALNDIRNRSSRTQVRSLFHLSFVVLPLCATFPVIVTPEPCSGADARHLACFWRAFFSLFPRRWSRKHTRTSRSSWTMCVSSRAPFQSKGHVSTRSGPLSVYACAMRRRGLSGLRHCG